MVNTEEAPQNTPENTGTFGKLKQTLSSSLLTAQDKGNPTNKKISSSIILNNLFQFIKCHLDHH